MLLYKKYTCEEGGAHLRISFWHLLMNLWNKYLLESCWSAPIKNKIILIFTMLHFFKKIKKNTWRYLYFTPVYQRSWWDDLQFLRYRVWHTEIGNFRSFFALLPPKNPKNQNFEKMIKIAGDIIILHMCTKNHNPIMYGSWDTEWDRQNFLSFWAIFCPFTLLMIPKIKIFTKWKKLPGDIMLLHMCIINDNHMINGSWDTERDGQNFFSFWTIFLPVYPPNTPKNKNFEKKWKNAWRYHHFTQAYQKSWSYATLFLRYDVWRM